MRQVRVVKSETYTAFVASQPSFAEDAAVAHFRAFYPTASVMIQRVQSPYARNTMLEILETLMQDLKNDCTSSDNIVSLT